MKTSRRGLFKALFGAAVAPALAKLAPAKPAINRYFVNSRDLGISVRMMTRYDAAADRVITRFDVLYGLGAFRPEFAWRFEDAAPLQREYNALNSQQAERLLLAPAPPWTAPRFHPVAFESVWEPIRISSVSSSSAL
jgi:hypothetical protein